MLNAPRGDFEPPSHRCATVYQVRCFRALASSDGLIKIGGEGGLYQPPATGSYAPLFRAPHKEKRIAVPDLHHRV